jgi:polysaccharide deacetylase family protein (PEP-CTERM system associated)
MNSVFSVDVEDGISIAMRDAFGKTIPQTDRVVSNTILVLELLSKYNVKGTFFTLGQVAEKFPDLIKRIANEGHELAVHGYDHWQFFKMTPEMAFDELSRAKKLIEDLSGQQVFGHRAPAFSIFPETKWGLDVVAEAGFTYDSSIMPCKTGRYGWVGFPKDIVTVETAQGNKLIEVPMTVDQVFHREIPVCGGGYLRLFPKWLTHRSFKRVLKKRPVIVYMHPYEVDRNKYPDYYFDELKSTTFTKNLKMRSFWVNRDSVYDKLESLLAVNKFVPMKDLIQEQSAIKTFKVS